MIPDEIMRLAQKGGYKIDLYWFSQLPQYAHAQFIIDPLFWSALGKSLGWGKETYEDIRGGYTGTVHKIKSRTLGHEYHAHRFYDLILQGKDTTEFWKEITPNT